MFAAASLKNALDEVNEPAGEAGGAPATISYAASSALAKQIEEGAPADLFISADLDWMDYLSERKLIRAGTGTSLLGNRDRAGRAGGIAVRRPRIGPGFDLAGAARRRPARHGQRRRRCRPARYGKAALEKLGALGGGRGQGRAGRERARRAAARRARRGAARHRLRRPTPRPSRRSGSSAPSRRTAIRRSSIRWRCSRSSNNADAGAFLDCLQSAEREGALRGAGLHGACARHVQLRRCRPMDWL